jgi:hypothetical protein
VTVDVDQRRLVVLLVKLNVEVVVKLEAVLEVDVADEEDVLVLELEERVNVAEVLVVDDVVESEVVDVSVLVSVDMVPVVELELCVVLSV